MVSRARSAVAPLYLLACLVLGGSAQGAWQNGLLQLAGVAILAWAAAAPARAQMPKAANLLLLLAMAALAVVALEQLPSPPAIWAHGPRVRIAQGYIFLGGALPWLPLSVAPYEAVATLMCLIPPLAMFVAIVRLRAYRPDWLVGVLLGGTLLGILVGALQVESADQNSHWYPYAETNFGSAVGFFANANHMATLLLIGLPFLAAIGANARSGELPHYAAILSGLAALALVLLVGIALNRSLAGYLLAVPVLAASALVIVPPSRAVRQIILAVTVLSMIAAVGALAASGIDGGRKIGRDARTAVQSRQVIVETTGKAIGQYIPFGSGLGSFLRVYRLYESPDSVDAEYVIHAHNDYAEVALELGIPGILLMSGFLIWWIATASAVWRTAGAAPFARAASIASAAVLVHSLVDFPLRTAAISACFAMCLGLLLERPRPPRMRPADLRPSRHLVFE